MTLIFVGIDVGCVGVFLLRWEITSLLWRLEYSQKLADFDRRLALRFGKAVVTGTASVAPPSAGPVRAGSGHPHPRQARRTKPANAVPDTASAGTPSTSSFDWRLAIAQSLRAIRAVVGHVLFVGLLAICLPGCIGLRLVYAILETITAEPGHLKESTKHEGGT